MKNENKKIHILAVILDSLSWLEGQEHLYGLTESGRIKYLDHIDDLKKLVEQMRGEI